MTQIVLINADLLVVFHVLILRVLRLCLFAALFEVFLRVLGEGAFERRVTDLAV